MKKTALLTALLFTTAALQAAVPGTRSFLPENDLSIPVGSVHAKGIQEAQFNDVLDAIERIYTPIVAAQGGTLKVVRKWTDSTVNAYAQQSGKTYIITMFGGLARHETITMDGFALVACHELGHHLGGAPKTGGWNTWASIEGQSDYYANLKCLRKVFSDPGSATFTRMAGGDEVAYEACSKAFTDAGDQAVCLRGAMAGKSVAYLFKALRNETVDPSFATPDTKVVTTMMTTHPPTQCRMDTYLQGSLCAQPHDAPLSNSDTAAGTCTRQGGWPGGYRPLCWYKPAKADELLPPGAREFDVTDELSPSLGSLKLPAWPGMRLPLP